jgi:hypothetical protein
LHADHVAWRGSTLASLFESADSIAGGDGFGGPFHGLPLLLGDPFLHDSMLQSMQAMLTELVRTIPTQLCFSVILAICRTQDECVPPCTVFSMVTMVCLAHAIPEPACMASSSALAGHLSWCV